MKVFPVIHLGETDISASVEQAHTAFELGADGVYLIDHYNGARDTSRLFRTHDEIKAADVNRYVGLNILGLGVSAAFGRVATGYTSGQLVYIPNDMWVDDVREKFDGVVDLDRSLRFRETLTVILGRVTLHGGVVFKYTSTATNNPLIAAEETRHLRHYVDVITTSGLGTGFPPTVEKLVAMKEAANGKPVAVASGIDISNIESFSGVVDEVLVASSVETHPGSGVFNAPILKDFIEIAHQS